MYICKVPVIYLHIPVRLCVKLEETHEAELNLAFQEKHENQRTRLGKTKRQTYH